MSTNYEVKTPALSRAMDLLDLAANGIQDGSLEIKEANALSMNAKARVGVVGMDIKARTAGPKIGGRRRRRGLMLRRLMQHIALAALRAASRLKSRPKKQKFSKTTNSAKSAPKFSPRKFER